MRDQLAEGLIHEDAAAVNRRADGVRGNEQDAQALGGGFDQVEAVAIIAAERAAESLGIGDARELFRRSPGANRARQLQERPAQRGEIGPAGSIAENDAEDRARPGEEQMREQTRRLVNIFPGEEQVVLFEHRLNLRFAEFLANGAAMLMIDNAT